MNVSLRHFPQIITDTEHGGDAENGQRQLSEFTLPPDAERHTRVQQVMKLEAILLIADDRDLLVQIHVLMNQQLGGLVNKNDNQGEYKVSVDFH